eukprot:CAMPEP_0202909992 /NCGR_PEP_ID=MMETSP1392-20130828/50783_1 /ASSEMBLY_ACC=CAM_ASM_000868 /TAXON_ID=225041 /ORGANISM="Chlamydomonas chlamydogama, Strain SAG 11-48b" /LENGTH=274 /DNA_ID=CAMNT_0049599937 /DNA_START=124 /DNA_END=948 /DNA_ORIENTATION=+
MASAEDDIPHPYTNYNKTPVDTAPTLIGNWVEERALKEATGTTRYETWVEKPTPSQTQTSIFATRQDRGVDEPTHPRVIEHSEQTDKANWTTMYRNTYQTPKDRPLLQDYKQLSNMGPRERRELEALMREAEQLPPEVMHTLTGPPVPQTLDSTYRAHFDEKDQTGLMIGARVMKDPDGRPTRRDPTFLAETQIMQKSNADRILKEEAVAAGATQTLLLPNPDIPITIYSESVAGGQYGSTFNGTRPMSNVLPFNKFTNFSKPMSEYNKVVIDE